MCRNILCIVGPTGVGKSSISLYLSQKYNGVIINADSRQVYANIPIITAQPTYKEQEIALHKFYGYLPLSEKISAGLWADSAKEEIIKSWKLGVLPILVGGTGMYFRAVLDGIVNIPCISNEIIERIEQKYKKDGTSLYYELKQVDPNYAISIHPNDQQRILRALMVFEATQKPFSWWHKHTYSPFNSNTNILRIGIKRSLSDLTPYLIKRIDSMFYQGAQKEIEEAYKQYPDERAPGWSSIGCIELLGQLKGLYTKEEARMLWIKNTRSYAKRQLTWFNADKRIQWFYPEECSSVYRCVDNWLQQA